MELTDQLGREIIHRLSRYIDVPMNLMDPSGVIVASTDPSRVDQLHGGAKYAIQTLEPQEITSQDAERFSNTKPGVNLPIFHRGVLAGVVGLTGEPKDVIQAAGMTQGSVEIALEQLFIQKQAFYQERQWSYWLNDLLNPVHTNKTELEREAFYTLRMDVKKSWQVLIFQTDDPFSLAEDIRNQVMDTEPLFVLPYQENMVVVPIPYQTAPLSTTWLKFGNYIGVGEPGYSAEGIRTSFQQAKEAIKAGRKKGAFNFSHELKMERLLFHIDPKTYANVVDTYENKLSQLEESYKKTLSTYFTNNLKLNRTAEQLHVHRNTLIYRLDQLHKKVGLDPRKFEDAIILQSILIHQ